MGSASRSPAGPHGELQALRHRVAELEEASKQQRRAADAMRFVIDATASATGEAFFSCLTRHLAAALKVRFAFVAELVDDDATRARLIAFWNHEGFAENFEYQVADTPCAHVVGRQLTCFPDRLQELFPNAPWTSRFGAQSYVAVPFFDSRGRPLGHMGVMHDGPLDDQLDGQGILRVLAGRAAAELERKRTAEALADRAQEQREFTGALASLVKIGNQLAVTDSRDELCRRAVELGREGLDFDRLGIWLLCDDRCTAVGSFGTDEQGHTRDERGQRVTLDPDMQQRLLEEGRLPVVRPGDHKLRDHRARTVGTGSYIAASMSDGRRIIGLIYADNLLRHQPCTERAAEILALYGSAIGHLYSRKQAEEALRQSETRFRMLAEHSLVGVYVVQDEKFRYVNPALAAVFGFAPDDMVDRVGPVDVTFPEDQPLVQEQIQRRIRGEIEIAHYTWRGRRRDGQIVHCESIGRRIEYEGRPAIMGTLIDITQRRRAEERLRLLSSAIEQSTEGIAVCDLDGNLLFLNNAFAAMHGHMPEQLLGRHLSILHSPDQLSVVQDANRQILETGTFRGEVWHVRKDGTAFLTSMHNSLVRDADDTPIAMIAAMRDVTNRKAMEEALRSSEYQYRMTLDAMGDAIHVADRDLRIVLVNKALRAWAGRLGIETDMVGKTISEVFPFLAPAVADEYRQVFDTKQVLVTQEEVSVAGQRIMTETRKIPILDGPQVTGVVTVMRDVTEQNRLQEQVRQSQKLESIGTLAGGIAHDFNNLLAVILGNASILQRQDELSPRVKDLLGDITGAAERGSALTHQLLAYARGGLQKPAPTDLNRVVKSVLQLLARTAPPQIDFVSDLPRDLPPVIGDPTQLEQVVMNLCLNAIQASEPPGTIHVATARKTLKGRAAGGLGLPPGTYLRLQVVDRGCGMNDETLQRAFEPFFTTKPMGRGMGLAAAQGIVCSHQGQIHLDSAPGAGTTATVWLPVSRSTDDAPAPAADARHAEPPHGSETVLVIDHDAAVAHMIEHSLNSLGYCAVTHNDAHQALAFLDTNAEDIDLVLANLHLPGLPADRMLHEIARRCPRAPVLFTSGLEVRPEIDHLISGGAAGFLHKPFSLMTLATTVRTALDGQGE